MAQSYGHLFTSQFKTTDALNDGKQFWAKYLTVKTPEQIAQALARMMKEYDKAPSLPEFMKLFNRTQEQALNAGAYDSVPQLTKENKLYQDGEPTPAKLLADKIRKNSPQVIAKDLPIKTINDEDHARRAKHDETYQLMMQK